MPKFQVKIKQDTITHYLTGFVAFINIPTGVPNDSKLEGVYFDKENHCVYFKMSTKSTTIRNHQTIEL